MSRIDWMAAVLGLVFSVSQPLWVRPVRGAEPTPDFQRDIRPILSEHCLRCHGMDEAARQGGLRLDVRDEALRGGDSAQPTIVPGNPADSALIARITSHDADVVMPPPAEKKPLTAQQIDVLTRWIADGATYAQHWSFAPPHKRSLPVTEPIHPIDAFVQEKLTSVGLTAAPTADPATRCRRLYLDLIGLPPSPAELDAFTVDGYEKTVETLLASERYGEKWARHWLDVARYSDTNGYEKDMPRQQWAYRDWVIQAFQRDMPYHQFIIEQIAGDRLPNPTQDQIIATGFLRNSMINEEGAIVAEQFRMVEMFDRLDCIGKAILGLTTQCAQCHSHKYDPLTQLEYYGMFAFLNNSYEAQSAVYTAEQQQKIQQLRQAMEAVNERLRESRPKWQEELAAWETEVGQQQQQWNTLVAKELDSIGGGNHPTQEADKTIILRGASTNEIFLVAEPQQTITGVRLELVRHGDMPLHGPGRGERGDWSLQDLEVSVRPPGQDKWQPVPLVNATADFSEPEQSSEQDNKTKTGPVAFLIDGQRETRWHADRGTGRRNAPSVAVVQLAQPLEMPAGTQIRFQIFMDVMVGACRFSVTSDPKPAALPIDHAAIEALQAPRNERTPDQRDAVFAAWRASRADCRPFQEEIETLWKEFPEPNTTILHLMEREGALTRTTHALDRGNWDQPQQVVQPHTPAALHALPTGPANDRLTFARWLADEHSPLTARVAVNRVWQAMFGLGLVETPEDFGTRSVLPEYRDLLDWLAVDFVEHGWSHKHLIRTIVTSQTYQQSSHVSPSQWERDPRNMYLARGPRFRAEAEVVRDMALSAAGLLSHRLGGPGVIPPVPQNVLDFNFTYPKYWIAAQGPERYRRAVYLYRKRSMPDPVLSNFDAPNSDFGCARRVRSNTPLAALTGLNETTFFEAAQGMALRVLREAGGSDAERVDYAYRLCTSRVAHPAEREEVQSLLSVAKQRVAEGWLNPRQIVTGDPGKLPELPPSVTPADAAAWTVVSRVLLNLDESISKN